MCVTFNGPAEIQDSALEHSPTAERIVQTGCPRWYFDKKASLMTQHDALSGSVALVIGCASGIGAAIFGVGTFGPFPNRFAGMTYDAALAAFEAEKPVRILFEEGGNAAYAPGTQIGRAHV